MSPYIDSYGVIVLGICTLLVIALFAWAIIDAVRHRDPEPPPPPQPYDWETEDAP